MMTISEGATIVGGEMVVCGEEDAFGHRKLGGIGQVTSELLKERTGQDMIYQQLGYLMRSGTPDSLDLMVAINYAVMATDLVVEGTYGRLVAMRDGNYANVPLRGPGRASSASTSRRSTTPRSTGRSSATSTASRCSCPESEAPG